MKADDEALEWEIRLWDRNPSRRWAVIVCALLAYAAGFAILGNHLAGLFGFLAICGSTTEMIFPLRYRLDARCARSRCGFVVNEIEWTEVRRIVPTDDGLLVSPLKGASRLDAFRGVKLRYEGNGDEVESTARRRWEGSQGVLDGGSDGGTD